MLFNSLGQQLYAYRFYDYESSFILLSDKLYDQQVLNKAVETWFEDMEDWTYNPSRDNDQYVSLLEFVCNKFAMYPPTCSANIFERPDNWGEISNRIRKKYESTIG
jgi:hypothetical protein